MKHSCPRESGSIRVPDGNSPERLHALDGLRAAMMLLGLVFHTVISYMPFPAWVYHDRATTPAAALIFFYIHLFRMHIFFALAGFFCAMMVARRGLRGMVRDRLRRIGIPFAVALFVVSPLVIAGADFAVHSRDGGLAEGWGRALAALRSPESYLPDRTHHLWFLYYLLYFYVATAALHGLCRIIPAETRALLTRRFGVLVARPVLRVVVPGAVTAVMFFFLGGFLPSDEALLPSPLNLLAYFTFFGFGLLLHAERQVLPTFTRLAWSQVIAATGLYLVMMLWALPRVGGWLSGPVSTLVVSLAGGAIAWMLLFGLTGLFLRYCNRPSPYVRYFVDASYWIYLTHYAFAFWLPGLVVNTGLSVWGRMAFVTGGMVAIGLVTYAMLVRSSFIGAVLNGRRYQRGGSGLGAVAA